MANIPDAQCDHVVDDPVIVLAQILAGDASHFGTVTLYLEEHQPKNVAHHDPHCPLVRRRGRLPTAAVMPLAGRRSFQSLGAERCKHERCKAGWKQIGERLAVVSTIIDASTLGDRFAQLASGVRPLTLKGQPVEINQLVAGYPAMCANLDRLVEDESGSLTADIAVVVRERLHAGYVAAEPLLRRLAHAEVFLATTKLPSKLVEPRALAYVFGGMLEPGLRAVLDAFFALDGPDIALYGPVWMSEPIRRLHATGPSRLRVPYAVACALLHDRRYHPEHAGDETFLARLVTTLLADRHPDSPHAARVLLDAARAVSGSDT